jgi:calmodulin
MEAATLSSYHNDDLTLAQAVVTFSAEAVLVWLSAAIKPTSFSSERRREASSPAAAPPSTPPPPETTAVLDMDAVLGVMGAGPASVGFDEAAALFEEEEATVEEARAAFAVFDRDGDGFIDAGELGSVLRSLGFGSGAEECRHMIDAYDEDRDGRIDFREFVKLMEQ